MDEKTLDLCRRRIFTMMKASAKKRRKNFHLERAHVQDLTEAPCAYCGAKSSNVLKYKGAEFPYNGIDRLNSALGYTVNNVVSCCKFCNTLKGSMKSETWMAFLRDITKTNYASKWNRGFDENRQTKRFFGGK